MTKLNHSLIFPVIIIENGDQCGLKKKNYMPKHLEPHFIQTMAVIVTEAGKIPVSLEAKSTDVMGIMR